MVGDGSTAQTVTSNTSITTNTKYNIEYVADGTNYKIYINGNLDISVPITQTLSYDVTDKSILIGKCYGVNNYYLIGSIDLKQFSITVDGVELFSGNKTGIDTIKPDDYTKVGSPTTSDDGIASGFSSSNYLTASVNIDTTKAWEVPIKCNCTYVSENSFGNGLLNLLDSSDAVGAYLAIRNSKIYLQLYGESAIHSDYITLLSYTFANNVDLTISLGWDKTKYYVVKKATYFKWLF